MAAEDCPADARDFFISFTEADKQWAEWIAWELEEAGYSTILQTWDFPAGSHFVGEMHRAAQITERTIAVLSSAYSRSTMAGAEWQEAFRQDPSGADRKLLVFRVEDCQRPGLLAQLVSVDLFAVDQDEARSRLLDAARGGRRKPPLPPGFPGREAPGHEPSFPGQWVKADLSAAMAAGGPMAPDNPYAVAFAWWHSIITLDVAALDATITPESRGQWDLEDLRKRTSQSGLTTGVTKPVFDVAYVKLMNEAPQGEGALKIEGGGMPITTMVISLVLRPELGGWRVHGVGYPMDVDKLPRTWSA